MNEFVRPMDLPATDEKDSIIQSPFPVQALPLKISDYVSQVSACIGCDPSYVALPAITSLASAIGNTHWVELKPGWSEPSVIWTATVGESGEKKTPPFKQVLKPIRCMQSAFLREWQRECDAYDQAKLEYDRALTKWKSKNHGDPPIKPIEPVARRILVSDTTVEALALRLADNPRGLLLARDELNAWLASFDQYGSGKGADVSQWLSMYNAEPLIVDRKSGNTKVIHVPDASVSITGGIQPNILSRAITGTNIDNGLAARILFSWPPRMKQKWTEAMISIEIEGQYQGILTKLLELEMHSDSNGNFVPEYIQLSPDAKESWIEYYNDHEQKLLSVSGPLASAFSKRKATAARLALIMQLTRWASGEAGKTTIELESMNKGIELARWFSSEDRRIYRMLSETEEERSRRDTVEIVLRLGGSASANDLRKATRKFSTNDEAETALRDLVAHGMGTFVSKEIGLKGGRPSEIFKLPESLLKNQLFPVERENA